METLCQRIDFSDVVGKIKPMHAAGGGPRQGYAGSWDISNYFRSMNIPYTRLHDIEYPFGSDLFVDIHCVFPDFDADENDPASYYFRSTDMYLKACMDVGCEPFYRLGESIDHTDNCLYINPPKDFAKWARICEHIIRHYNEGWADGFRFGIRYWEIWNEPDSYLPGYNRINMWTGTQQQYFELYEAAAKHLKKCFGDSIRIGGYSACNLNALVDKVQSRRGQHLIQWAEAFLKFVRESGAPLDFFSYHRYFNDPKEMYEYNTAARRWLDEMGFANTEAILTEYNCGPAPTVEERRSTKMGADLGYIFLSCQKTPVDMMMYYFFSRANSTFSRVIGPNKEVYSSYYAFCMFGRLYALGSEVFSGGHDPESDIALVAAKNDKKGGIMIANVGESPKELHLELEGAEAYRHYTVYSLDSGMSPDIPTVIMQGSVQKELSIRLDNRFSLTYIDFE